MRRRVVVTGIGVFLPSGFGKHALWDSLKSGQSHFSDISLFDTTNIPVKQAGEIKDFDPSQYFEKKIYRTLDRSILFLNIAANEALQDSGINIDDTNRDMAGVSIGATYSSMKSRFDFDRVGLLEGPRYVNPSHFPNTLANGAAGYLAIHHGLRAFNTTISTGICASSDAIKYGYNFIKHGRANIVLSGGVEELGEEFFFGMQRLGLLAESNGSGPVNYPFDKRRSGFVFSEGSVLLVLEALDSALSRGAHIYAEILGAASSICHDGPDMPSHDGIVKAIEGAIQEAGISKESIDYICASANSSKHEDLIEARAIREVFGDALNNISISASKSITGEMYSASGATAVAGSIGSIRNGYIPATVNYEHKDDDIMLNISNKGRNRPVANVLVNSVDHLGNSTSIILGAYRE